MWRKPTSMPRAEAEAAIHVLKLPNTLQVLQQTNNMIGRFILKLLFLFYLELQYFHLQNVITCCVTS
jgi:hypothetical protein